MSIFPLDGPPFDGLDIGYCPRCGADMSGEPASALRCGACIGDDDD